MYRDKICGGLNPKGGLKNSKYEFLAAYIGGAVILLTGRGFEDLFSPKMLRIPAVCNLAVCHGNVTLDGAWVGKNLGPTHCFAWTTHISAGQ